MVFLNIHEEFGLKHTMVLQLSYGVFWIERIFINWKAWSILVFDGLLQPHNFIPYVQIGLSMCL
jgi:hypothetical protein